MSENRYRLAFSGRLSPGFDPQRLEQDLTKRMGPQQGARIAAMLQQGKRVIVAKGLSLVQAEALQRRLLDLGLDVAIEDPAPPNPSLPPVRNPARATAAQPGGAPATPILDSNDARPRRAAPSSCPSCGAPRSGTGVRCKRCGAYFHGRDANLAAQTAPRLDRESLKNTATELAGGQIIEWIKSQGKLALIGLIIIPVFGSGIAMSTLFVTKEHHVVYETEELMLGCMVLDDEWHMPTTTRGNQMMAAFLETYKDEDIHPSDLYQIYGERICVRKYNLRMGNIGAEPMPAITVALDTDSIADGFLDEDPVAHARFRIEDLYAAEPRGGDPIIEWADDGTMMEVKDLPVGTYLELNFHTWYPEGKQMPSWDRLLVSIDAAEGSVDYANPRATMLGRVLGDIF